MKLLQVHIDPLDRHHGMTADQIRESLGVIPVWIAQDGGTPDLYHNVLGAYGYGERPSQGFTMRLDGTLEYPDDPPMYPLAKMEPGNDWVVYQYHYGFVAFIRGNFQSVVRMD